MRYKISKLANQDLENIWLYSYKNWSVEQADRYFNLLINEIEYLSKKPYSGTDFSSVRKGYFRSKVKSHYIFYRIDQTNKNIETIRILHQNMATASRLND